MSKQQEQQQQIYRPDPQLVQLQMQFAQALQEAQRKAATAVNIRATEAMKDHLLPLIEMSVALTLGGQQDMANYMRVLAANEGPEVLIGLDNDTADDFITELQNIEVALTASLHLAASDTNLLGQLQKALESINDLKEAVNDMALDVDSDDEEETEEEEDEEGSDEPLKIVG
jgi:hypothetical protein